MKNVAVFGSTGAIGCRTLEVIGHLKDRLRVTALVANENVELLAKQAKHWKPKTAVLLDESRLPELQKALRRASVRATAGVDALVEIAARPSTDIVVMALSGTKGLDSTLAALDQGKRVAIATKEIIVGYGRIVMARAREHGAEILPIDSELSAIHQCLQSVRSAECGMRKNELSRIILTASGGPFLRRRDLSRVTLKQALDHPIWDMGRKITVDSATLMNKGLEIVETAMYFGVEPEQIEVLIHPQSIVHSLVEFRDGSMLAQLAAPDMRLPIQYALTFPERHTGVIKRMDLAKIGKLTFEVPDHRRFPCLGLAVQALRDGGLMPCVLNMANEIAVHAFLAGELEFHQIPEIVADVLNRTERVPQPTLEDLRLQESVTHDFTLWLASHWNDPPQPDRAGRGRVGC